ncbi:MAG: phosphoribosylamine--glycine ligase [Gammaproteobacteria bacterium]|nr:MAG: phosphoribosylamine--glycine ligase [Gammaproteobacteria bacterium]
MHILLIGNGGREHAIAWKLAQSPRVNRISVAPGNPGTAAEPGVENLAIDVLDTAALIDFAHREKVDLTIAGPEAPLVAGVADAFHEAGLRFFGPMAAAARLEGSKSYARAFMQQHGIPSPGHAVFDDVDAARRYIEAEGAPIVIKADGLAAGKGVVVAHSVAEAIAAAEDMLGRSRFGEAGARIVVEGFLAGEEASFIAVVSGRDCIALASSQDHKARDEGDRGPNTGGMGAYSPAPVVTDAVAEKVMTRIIQPTADALADNGTPFVGFLYAGLMIDAAGDPTVVEFNVRLGDPETQPLMMRLDSDLLPLIEAAVDGKLAGTALDWKDGSAIGIVVAAESYPAAGSKGAAISGIDEAEALACKVFHAGTADAGGELVTNGGRVVCVTSHAGNLAEAQAKALKGAERIRFDGARFRRDIGHHGLAR